MTSQFDTKGFNGNTMTKNRSSLPPVMTVPANYTINSTSNDAEYSPSAPIQLSEASDGTTPQPNSDGTDQISPLEVQKPYKKPSIFSADRYKHLFDVHQSVVFWRLLKSILFCGPAFYGPDPHIRHNVPDLYGPFWITTTLILVMGFIGSIQQNKGSLDITKVSYSAIIFYCGLTIPPFILYWFLRWFRAKRSLSNIISLYGYSFFIYIPMAICSIAPVPWVDLITCGSACGVSTLFLVKNVYCYFLQQQNELYQKYHSEMQARAPPPPPTEPIEDVEVGPDFGPDADGMVELPKKKKLQSEPVSDNPNRGIGVILMIGVIAVHLLIGLLSYIFFFYTETEEPAPTPTPEPTPAAFVATGVENGFKPKNNLVRLLGY